DRRPRIPAGRLLVDRYRRAKPLDVIDVWLVHLAEELAGVGGEGLDIPPLPLRVEGIERERRLSGAGEAGDDHQLVTGNLQVDILQVVLPRPTNHDPVMHRHAILRSSRDGISPNDSIAQAARMTSRRGRNLADNRSTLNLLDDGSNPLA